MMQFVSKIVVICYYHANKGYISENLCVNRSKPESCCKGTCFLDTKLQKTENQSDRSIPSIIKLSAETIVYIVTENELMPAVLENTGSFCYQAYVNQYSYLSFSSIFHPPNSLFI